MASPKIYRLKITLRGTAPPVWRRVDVQEDSTLDHLHRVLQITMGWQNCHLYAFRCEGAEYRLPRPDDKRRAGNTRQALLQDVLTEPGDQFEYIYDFGDDWQHDLQLESIFEAETNKMYPCCLDGAGACPPEDVGGSAGFAEYLEATANPEHELHEEMTEWRGSFDSESFSVEETNQQLKKNVEFSGD